MNINANIETAGTVREKVKSALGFDCASALDLVRREDFANEEAYRVIQSHRPGNDQENLRRL